MDTTQTTPDNPTTPTSPGGVPDLRPVLAQALDQTERLVAQTSRADASGPTPCSEFTVAELIGHLLGVVSRIGVVAEGKPFHLAATTGITSDDWAGDWAARRSVTDASLDAADLGLTVTVPWGEVTVGQALASYISELATHAWDLAVATGRLDELDNALAAAALPAARAKIPAAPRGGDIPFGPVIDTPADAPEYDQLVAWCGRDPQWRP